MNKTNIFSGFIADKKNFKFKETMETLLKKLNDMLKNAEKKQEKLSIEYLCLLFIYDCIYS